jgi:hypothetical protein
LFATSATSGIVQLGRVGDVTGPEVSTDHALTRYDGATGNVIQDSGVTLSDANVMRHAGTVEWDKGADIASAAALLLGDDGNYFDVTGTTAITSVSAKPIGTRVLLQFDAQVTVTHHATALILKSGTNFVAEAGNHLELASYDGTNWREVGRSVPDAVPTSTNDRANRILLGDLLNYPLKGQVTSDSDIQYTQVYLRAGETISNIETFIDGGSGDTLRMGLYSQTDPTDFEGDPVTRVAQTDTRDILVGDNGTFVIEATLSPYIVPTTGYYWLALIVDGKSVKFAVTSLFRANYLPLRIEAGTGVALPATVGTITNGVNAVMFVAGILD